MSDLTTAAADLEAAETARETAKEAMADAKSAMEAATAALVVASVGSSDEEIKGAGEAVAYCNTEIERLTYDESDGLNARKAAVTIAFKAMREAAKKGNAQAEEANLAAAEDELREVRGAINDLKKARKNAEASLRRLVAGIA